jgi:hypothetical protein
LGVGLFDMTVFLGISGWNNVIIGQGQACLFFANINSSGQIVLVAVVCDVCKDEFAAEDLETQEFHHVRWLHLNTVTSQKKRVG